MEISAIFHAGNEAARADGPGPDEAIAAASKRTPRGLHRPWGAIGVALRLLLACLLLAAVALAPSTAAAQSEGDLRLIGGIDTDSPRTGRLEIYHTQSGETGRWGPICDDAFRIHEARVACKQLGYGDAKRAIIRYSKTHSMTTADFWLDDLDCNGTESKLTDCKRWQQNGRGHVTGLQWGQHNCVPEEQVGVECTADTTSNSIQIDKRKLVVAEGLSAPFTVRLGKVPTADVTVTMTVNSGPDLTLKDGDDTISTLTFTTGNWNVPQTVTVAAASDTDTADEAGITIGFSSTGGGYQGASSPTLKVEIRDDDTKGITITPTRLNSYETDSANQIKTGVVRSYTVEMTGAPSEDVTINLAVAANTPGGVGATDITLEPSTLTFTTSNWSGPRTVTPKVTKDADAISETVTISHTIVTEDSDYSAMNLPDVTMEVKDVGGYGPGLSVDDVTVTEGTNVTLDFKVTLFPSSTGTVRVRYKTVEGTATAGEDYTFTSGLLIFAPGETEKTVSVPVIDDSVEDSGNTLWFMLTVATGATIDDQWGLGTILNSETSGDNTAPTGSPTISGTARVGETLTASSTEIADTDGLTNANFAWQWMASDETDRSDIAGATSETYTLTSAEQGKTIQVRATFTDDGGTEETLVSAATEAVTAAVQQQVASDTDPPTVSVTSDATGTVTGDFDVTVTFSEAVTGFEMSELSITNGSATRMLSNEAGDAYTVTITPDPGASGTLSVEVPAGVASDAAENANTASGAFGIAVRTALSASFSELPSSHDGSTVFTFTLTFSEDVSGLSFRTLKFGGIGVTGGTVRRALRRPPGRNQYWTIHVEPDTDGDLTITLPEASDCAATGAVCTSEGHKLTGAVSATIPGPASEPRVSIAAGTSPVTEGAAASFTLSRRGGPTTALSVDLSVSEDGSMVDGTAPSTATFAAGSTTATLTVATADDEVEESASVITATVSSGTGYALDTGAESASVTVEDDDGASANAAPTGLPTITGAAKVGQTLTASETGIADDDGLTNASFTWQWIANDGTADAEIAGATGATYTLTAAEEGKTIKVRATFTDDGGREETLESAATEAVAALSTVPVWSATVTVGADGNFRGLSTMANPDVGSASLVRFDYGSETTLRYTVQIVGANTDGVIFKVRSRNDDLSGMYLEWAGETLPLASAGRRSDGRFIWGQSWLAVNAPSLSASSYVSTLPENGAVSVCLRTVGQSCSATVAESTANAAPTGLPTITGAARVGETLTASESGIADDDGLTNASFTWQWIANDGTDDTDIADATGATYTLTAAEEGKTIKVRATFTDDGGTEETLESAVTDAVAAALPRVSIAATSSPVTEGAAAAFTLSRTGDATAALTVAVSVSEAGSVLSGTPASSVTFAAGNATAALSLATENDDVDEADARVTVSVSSGTGYSVAPDAASAGVDVYDDDAAASGEATVTTLWSTTLEWTDLNGNVIANAADFADAGWSEDGDAFRVWYFAYDPYGGDLWLRMNSSRSAGDIPRPGELTLRIGDETVQAGDALSAFSAGNIGTVSGVWQDWEEGDRVSVRLTRTEAAETTASLPGLSVADAQVNESSGAPLSFSVTLGAAQTSAVSVRYATSDGTATAGADYEAVSGILRFEAGETSKTVSVPVINDDHDDDGETMTLTLSSPFGAEIIDGAATGTINNTDPMPKAWLARFGRVAAEHVTGAIGERLRGGAGTQVTLAGQALDFGGDPQLVKDEGGALLFAKNDSAAALPTLMRDSGEDVGLRPLEEDGETSIPELLLASSFHLASAGDPGSDRRWSVWGRGARSSFDGAEGALTLEGEVTTATLGLDIEQSRWLLGVALSRSAGEGSYLGDATCRSGCDIESALTGVYPYARYRVSERLELWGVVGHGQGDMTLSPEGMDDIDTDIEMSMAAAGARGVVLPASEKGDFELALRADLLVTRTSSDAVSEAGTGRLAETESETSRLRLLLEGSRSFSFGEHAVLTPSVELGLRYDGGDAERGAGLELGGALRYAAGSLTVEVSARGLLAHSESDYEEWGVSGSVRLAPGTDGRGLSMRLGSGWGATSGGAEQLFSQANGAFGAGRFDPDARLDAEVAYGLDAPRGLLTPYTGVAYSENAETWRAGARWKLGPEYEVSVEASLKESPGGEEPESGLLLRGSKRW